jgi:hypothetical protein
VGHSKAFQKWFDRLGHDAQDAALGNKGPCGWFSLQPGDDPRAILRVEDCVIRGATTTVGGNLKQ